MTLFKRAMALVLVLGQIAGAAEGVPRYRIQESGLAHVCHAQTPKSDTRKIFSAQALSGSLIFVLSALAVHWKSEQFHHISSAAVSDPHALSVLLQVASVAILGAFAGRNPSRENGALGQVVAGALLIPCMLATLILSPWILWGQWHKSLFFSDKRVGQHDSRIILYKVKSLTHSLETQRVVITSFGRFARPLRLDEWPQLLSILVGDMAWFGPRAMQRSDLDERYIRDVLSQTKPGLMSWNNLRRVMIAELPGRARQTLDDRTAYDLEDLRRDSTAERVRLVLASILVWFALLWKVISPFRPYSPLMFLERRFHLDSPIRRRPGNAFSALQDFLALGIGFSGQIKDFQQVISTKARRIANPRDISKTTASKEVRVLRFFDILEPSGSTRSPAYSLAFWVQEAVRLGYLNPLDELRAVLSVVEVPKDKQKMKEIREAVHAAAHKIMTAWLHVCTFEHGDKVWIAQGGRYLRGVVQSVGQEANGPIYSVRIDNRVVESVAPAGLYPQTGVDAVEPPITLNERDRLISPQGHVGIVRSVQKDPFQMLIQLGAAAKGAMTNLTLVTGWLRIPIDVLLPTGLMGAGAGPEDQSPHLKRLEGGAA